MFKYDIHVHCKESSACGNAPARDLVHAYKKGGYAGFVMTNHFTPMELDLNKHGTWEKAIEYHTKGYFLAKDEAKSEDIDVFFGFEFRFKGHDFLVYGIDIDWLLANPDIFEWSFKEFSDKIHEAGGFINQAHPARPLSSGEVMMFPTLVDAFEIYNGSHVEGSPYPPLYNMQAEGFAKANNMIGLAGSDTHDIARDGTPYRKASVILGERPTCIEDMICAFREGKFSIYTK